MARKKVVTTEEIDTAEDQGLESNEVIDMPSPEQMDIMDELLALGGEASIKFRVYRLPTKPGDREAYCQDYERETFNLDTVREMFGGGLYRITALSAGNKYAGSKRVTLADLPKSATSGGMAGPSADLAAILQAAKGDNSGGPMMQVMMQLFKSQSDTLAAILSRPPPAAPPAPTMMEIVAMMRELNRDQPKSEEGGAVKLLLQGIELGKEFAGGGGENTMLDLAGKGIDMLRPMIERGVQAPSAQAVTNPARPAQPALTAPQPAAQATPATENDPMLRQLNWLRAQTQALCVQASRGKSPELYAEVLLDNLPDFISADELLARLSEPGAVAQLAQLNSNVAQYAPWFEELRKAILEFLKPEDTGGTMEAEDTGIGE